jgi:WD40 repeat protein
MNGGIGIIEMFQRTNLLALVGGGKNPKFQINQLIIWDDHQGKIISKLRFNENLMSVRLRNNKIIVLTRNKFYAFNMKTLVTIAIIKTYDNPLGIIATSNGDINNKLIVAFPYESQGHVFLGEITQKCEKLSVVQAHDSKIACISINKDGTLLATASDKGTLIRIFTTNDGQKFSEFRRGTKTVEMNCIAFDPNNKFIGCSSNVGTIHIFSIAAITKALDEKNNKAKNEIEDEPKNSKSFLGKIGGLLNIKNAYLESERSFAKFKVQEENSILGFGSENTFVVITMNGKYYKAAYNPKRGGDCCKIEEKNILNDF